MVAPSDSEDIQILRDYLKRQTAQTIVDFWEESRRAIAVLGLTDPDPMPESVRNAYFSLNPDYQ